MRIRVFFGLLALLASAGSVRADEFANAVFSFSPGSADLGSVDLISENPCRGSGRPLSLLDALGAPDQKYVTIGDDGSITLTFPHEIGDEAGPDVRVHVSCNIGCEPGEVFASQDGIHFVRLGALDTAPFMDYDLESVGLDFAGFIRVHDMPGGPCPGQGLASDLNTIQSLHPVIPVTALRQSWGRVKTIYR